MKYFFLFLLLFSFSCGYPDIDSVPSFKNLELTDEELFDLCELSSTDKSQSDRCNKNKQKN